VLGGLESIRKGLIKYHELGLTTKEIYADLKEAGWGKSLRTLQSHQTELRKEGLLPSAAPRGIHAVCAETCAKPVENSTPIPVTPVTTEIIPPSYVSNTEYREPVLASVTVVDDTAERDYEQALEHIDAIIKLTKKYFHKGWDDRKWYELAGECRTIEACCTNHCGSNFGAGSQRSSRE
jgi:hypothetical protein